jgi:outer membrane protein OmpA-like peptidoglycan-associated protein
MKNGRALALSTITAGLLLSYGSQTTAQNWQNTDKINNWFDRQAGKQYSIRGTKEVQKAGTIKEAGEIQIPHGWAAVKVVKKDCQQRLTVCADTLFEFDKSTLSPDAAATLKLIGPKIAELGAHPITIEGHTDGKGTDEYNQSLSERRAERVKNWLLTNHFVHASGTATVGYGKKHPVAPNVLPDGNDYPVGRQKNRRVEIVVDTCTALGENAQSATPGVAGTTTIKTTTSTSNTSTTTSSSASSSETTESSR